MELARAAAGASQAHGQPAKHAGGGQSWSWDVGGGRQDGVGADGGRRIRAAAGTRPATCSCSWPWPSPARAVACSCSWRGGDSGGRRRFRWAGGPIPLTAVLFRRRAGRFRQRAARFRQPTAKQDCAVKLPGGSCFSRVSSRFTSALLPTLQICNSAYRFDPRAGPFLHRALFYDICWSIVFCPARAKN